MCGLFSIDFYRPYFNVDTSQVKTRLLQATWPKQTGTPFLSDEEGSSALPDLYGPLWVSLPSFMLEALVVGCFVDPHPFPQDVIIIFMCVAH